MSNIKRIDYTSRDYEGFKQDMISRIPQRLPEWTDRSDNDAGIVILELLAHQLETISYYNDRVANEVFLSTATQRRSVINHCKLIGYELSWHKASRFYQVFEIVPQPTDTVIPKGTQVGTKGSDIEEPVIFETMEDLIIPSGETGLEKDENGEFKYMVEIEQGQSILNEFLGNTDGQSDQRFGFAYSPILRDSIKIYVQEPSRGMSTWEQVQDFINSNQDSHHYVTEMNEYDEVFVKFGNGTSGRIPEPYSKVFADYKVGGGTIGNVGTNTITEIFDSIPGFVSTFNPYEAHVKGEDKEDIDEAKWRGPASLRQLNRYVTLPDYEEGLRLRFNWIARVKAVNVDGTVALYIVPKDNEQLTARQREEILADIEEKKVIFTIVNIHDVPYVDFEVSIDLRTYDNYDPKFIAYAGENLVRDMFSKENMEFNKDITVAQLHHLLLSIEGVRNAIVTLPSEDIEIGEIEIGRLTNVNITVNGLSY